MKQLSQQYGRLIRNRPIVVLSLIIFCAALLQGILAANKTTLTHDETISYLSATGHQGEFEQIFQKNLYPANQWVRVGEWRAWFEIAKPFSFRQIGRDLAETDIHPPLYFWLLHIWTWLFGIYLWTGPTLNIVFQAIGALGLFYLARRVLRDDFEALAVVFIWSISPAILTTAFEARQYSLFGICTIYFVWQIIILVDQSSSLNWIRWLLLAIATVAGALTQYHFVLVVAGALLVFVLKLLKRQMNRVVFITTAVVTGYLLALILHPRFYDSFQELARRQALEVQQLSGWLAFFQRVYAVGSTFTGFWTTSSIIQLILFCIALASIIWLGLVLGKNPNRVRQYVQSTNFAGYEVGLFGAWLGGISIVLYLTYVSPVHAMTARHMSSVWPFFPFLPILLLRKVKPSRSRIVMASLATAVLLSSLSMVWQEVKAADNFLWDDVGAITAKRVITDGVYRGILPRIFLQLPEDTFIFVASQNNLLQAPEAWLPMLETNSIYISDLSYENTEENRDKILELLQPEFQIVVQPDDSWPIGRRYLLEPLN